jgi:hypothetical protein
MKINLGEIECNFYIQNITFDNKPIASINGVQIMKSDAIKHIDTFVFGLSDMVEVMAITDERFEKYNTALSFLKIVKLVLQSGNISEISDIQLICNMAEIAIDVIKEIALFEVEDYAGRTTIKAASFSAKKFIEFVGKRACVNGENARSET